MAAFGHKSLSPAKKRFRAFSQPWFTVVTSEAPAGGQIDGWLQLYQAKTIYR